MTFNSNNIFKTIPPVTRNIIIINVIVWVATYIFRYVNIELDSLLGLHYFQADSFRVYQLFTYMFLHDTSSPAHIFFNMFAVYMFGRIIETTWGQKRFWVYYTITGIGAGLIQEVTWHFSFKDLIESGAQFISVSGLTMPTRQFLYEATTVGASGAVFGILLAFGMLFPNASLYLMFIPIPIKAKYFVVIYGFAELFLGIVNYSGDPVAHFAHLGGMLFGLILILYWKQKDKKNGYYY